MKHLITLALVILTALVVAVSAGAKPVEKPWYLHLAGQSGHYVCDRDAKDNIGVFETKDACEAAIPSDDPGDDDGGPGDDGGGGGDQGGGDDDGGGVTVPALVVGAETPDAVFLCYSVYQHNPGVWDKDQAAELVALGYTEAQAVAGNEDGAANVGAYHLVCNSGLTDTGSAVGDNGTVWGPDYGPADTELGFYALYA